VGLEGLRNFALLVWVLIYFRKMYFKIFLNVTIHLCRCLSELWTEAAVAYMTVRLHDN